MYKRTMLIITAITMFAALASPALASGERNEPPPGDEPTTTAPPVTTTTTAPPVTTTTTAPPVTTTTTAPPVTTTTAPPVTTTTVPAVPVPGYTVSLACPGTFVIELTNTGTAPARFTLTQQVDVTGRTATSSEIVVAPGATVTYEDFMVFAGEEGAAVIIGITESVTGLTAIHTTPVVDCTGLDTTMLFSSNAEATCIPDVIERRVLVPGPTRIEVIEAASAAEPTEAGLGWPLAMAAAAMTLLGGLAWRRSREQDATNT